MKFIFEGQIAILVARIDLEESSLSRIAYLCANVTMIYANNLFVAKEEENITMYL